MKILLDTHILLWWLSNSKQLPKPAYSIIENPANTIFVSAASLWEIALKQMLDRITVSFPDLQKAVEGSGFLPLPITFDHCGQIGILPLHHRDPFDRMLVAQSMIEPAILLTHDKTLKLYGSTVKVV